METLKLQKQHQSWILIQKTPFRSHSECRQGEAQYVFLPGGTMKGIWPFKLHKKPLFRKSSGNLVYKYD